MSSASPDLARYLASASASRSGSDMSMPSTCASTGDAGAQRQHAAPPPRLNQRALAWQTGAGTDKAHVAGDDIPDLRKFIKLVVAERRAERRDGGWRRFMARRVLVSKYIVRNLRQVNGLPLPADTRLAENAGAGRLPPHPYSEDQDQKSGRQSERQRYHEVKQPLHLRASTN